ncbi:hypothetical protein, partial [Proteiniclasticum ruminis]|uniref:hypothetical protein n=1 Tax=Proteiniclasticum ruminis TaxID=398199 RepID=UPI0028A9AF30
FGLFVYLTILSEILTQTPLHSRLTAVTNIWWLAEATAVLWNIVFAKTRTLKRIAKTTYSIAFLLPTEVLIRTISP